MHRSPAQIPYQTPHRQFFAIIADKNEFEQIDKLSERLKGRIVGQDEAVEKVAKAVRKETLAVGFSEDDDEADENNLVPTCSWFEWDELKSGLRMEAGDILWQLAGLCHVMGWSLEDVAIENLGKLEARKKAGTIDGDGDGIIR
jgi:NTP pyrophosphatase (non-canonical NTP hydrolase)